MVSFFENWFSKFSNFIQSSKISRFFGLFIVFVHVYYVSMMVVGEKWWWLTCFYAFSERSIFIEIHIISSCWPWLQPRPHSLLAARQCLRPLQSEPCPYTQTPETMVTSMCALYIYCVYRLRHTQFLQIEFLGILIQSSTHWRLLFNSKSTMNKNKRFFCCKKKI